MLLKPITLVRKNGSVVERVQISSIANSNDEVPVTYELDGGIGSPIYGFQTRKLYIEDARTYWRILLDQGYHIW